MTPKEVIRLVSKALVVPTESILANTNSSTLADARRIASIVMRDYGVSVTDRSVALNCSVDAIYNYTWRHRDRLKFDPAYRTKFNRVLKNLITN